MFPDDQKEKMIDLSLFKAITVSSPDNTYHYLHPPGKKYEEVEVGMM